MRYICPNALALDNGYKCPLVFSDACLTGALYADCFGASFMHGIDSDDPNAIKEPRGAIGFIGASRDTYANDWSGFLMALFGSAIVPDDYWNSTCGLSTLTLSNEGESEGEGEGIAVTWRPAVALTFAKMVSPGGFYRERDYNYQGDPELMLRTGTPQSLNVTLAYRNNNSNSPFVTVNWASGAHVYCARVVVSHSSEPTWVGLTGHNGEVDIPQAQISGGSIVVTAHNAIPWPVN